MAVTHSDKFGLRLWAVSDGVALINAANIMSFITDILIYLFLPDKLSGTTESKWQEGSATSNTSA